MRGVKNSYSHEINFWPFVEKRLPDECWAWHGAKQKAGYGQVWRDGRPRGAHRIAWEIANDRRVPHKLWVLHHCDNPNCVNPAHLFIGTPRDNHQDQIAKGRRQFGLAFTKHPELIKRGEENSAAKLTEEQIKILRRKATLGNTQAALAKEFHVCQSAISLIVHRKRWAHI